jgi:hypothetical protein
VLAWQRERSEILALVVGEPSFPFAKERRASAPTNASAKADIAKTIRGKFIYQPFAILL